MSKSLHRAARSTPRRADRRAPAEEPRRYRMTGPRVPGAQAPEVAPPASPKVIYVRDLMVAALGLSLACGTFLLGIIGLVVIAGAGQ